MRVAVAFDHRGVKLRERVLEEVVRAGHEPVDLGTDVPEPRIDYPDKAREIGGAILNGYAERGYRTVFNCNAEAGQTVFHVHLHLLAGRRLGWPPG